MKSIFSHFISEHGFDNQLEHYFSTLALSNVGYLYTYSSFCNTPCLRIDFDNCKQLSRITIWESGECNIEVISIKNSTRMIDESSKLKTIGEFEDKLLSLVEYIKMTDTLH